MGFLDARSRAVVILVSALGCAPTYTESGGYGGADTPSGPLTPASGIPDDFGDGGSTFPPDDDGCDQSVPLETTVIQAPPDVLLVVDYSGSMGRELIGSGQEKWTVMRNALRMILTETHNLVHYGLMLYPSDGMCGAGNVAVNVAPQSGLAVANYLDSNANDPSGSTPTHTTLESALRYYSSIPVNPAGRYVLLATDGLPNCNGGTSGASSVEESVNAVAALAAAGVQTYVIGFGDGVSANPDALQRMATAGDTGQGYFAAGSPAQLQAALADISADIIRPPCYVPLEGGQKNPELMRVDFDGALIERDTSHVDGWDYDTIDNSITFFGASCEHLQSGTVAQLNVAFGCDTLQ